MTMLTLPEGGGGGGGGSGVAIYQLIADLPASAPDGTVASVIENQSLYQYDATGMQWFIVAGPGGEISSVTAPLQYDTPTQTLSIDLATTTNDGYLSATDWNTFNNKVSTSRTIGTAGPLSGGGDLSADRTFAIPQADGSTDGYLDSEDWMTFNDKAPTSSPTFSGTVTISGRILMTEGTFGTTGIVASESGNDTGINFPSDGVTEFWNNAVNSMNMGPQGVTSMNGIPLIFPNVQGSAGSTYVNDGSGNLSFGTPTITGATSNKLAYYNSSNVLTDLPVSNINQVFGVDYNIPIAPNNTGGINVFPTTVQFTPTAPAPNDGFSIHIDSIDFDLGSTGFPMSTSSGIAIYNTSLSHQGTGDLGFVQSGNTNINIGNGTDPISVNGFQAYNYNGQINDNVTIVQALQGWAFGINVQSGATFAPGAYVAPFGDFANIQTAVGGYNSFNAGPTLSEIQNNSNYVGYQVNANIASFTGNAGYFGLVVGGNLGTFDTGSYNGIQVNPTVTSVVNATGLYINMNNVTASGNKKAIDVTGDVSINGALSFSGSLTIGQLNSFSSFTLTPSVSPGQPTTNNSLVTQINGTANTIDADTLGINTAALINIDPGVTITTSFIGIAALGLPAVANIGAGASVDNIAGALFALSLGGGTGTIDNVYLCRALAIPDGTTTVNKLYGYAAQMPFGAVGTSNWGFYESGYQQNFMEHALKIGGTPGSNDTPSNASVGIELDSTTQAVLLSRMTTTERNALTALDGMLEYNVTTNTFQGYQNGSWADFAVGTFLSATAPNDVTNASYVGSGQVPASAAAAANDLETSTATFSRDIMEFTVYEATGRKAMKCFACYASTGISAISDPGGLFLNSDAGTGIYVFKSAASNVISVKNRLGSTVTITIQATNSEITSATAWA
jgi:hypothetical protein